MSADIIGRGWRFPIEPDATGGLGYVGSRDNLDQSLRIVPQILAKCPLGSRSPRRGARQRHIRS